MKVSELESPELDYWVGMAMGLSVKFSNEHVYIKPRRPRTAVTPYYPSRNWVEAGPIIETEWPFGTGVLAALTNGRVTDWGELEGKVFLLYVMRAVVLGAFGDEVCEYL